MTRFDVKDEVYKRNSISTFLNYYIVKFVLNFNNGDARNYTCQRVTFAICSHGQMLTQLVRLPETEERVIGSSKLFRGNEISWE